MLACWFDCDGGYPKFKKPSVNTATSEFETGSEKMLIGCFGCSVLACTLAVPSVGGLPAKRAIPVPPVSFSTDAICRIKAMLASRNVWPAVTYFH